MSKDTPEDPSIYGDLFDDDESKAADRKERERKKYSKRSKYQYNSPFTEDDEVFIQQHFWDIYKGFGGLV